MAGEYEGGRRGGEEADGRGESDEEVVGWWYSLQKVSDELARDSWGA